MEYEVGKEYEMKKKNGNTVKRMCMAVIPKELLEQQAKLPFFAPVFVKDGVVWGARSEPQRKTLSPAERAKREKDKADKKAKTLKKRLESAEKRRETEAKKEAKYKKELESLKG